MKKHDVDASGVLMAVAVGVVTLLVYRVGKTKGKLEELLAATARVSEDAKA